MQQLHLCGIEDELDNVCTVCVVCTHENILYDRPDFKSNKHGMK